jgi:hypothetical protein
MEGSGRIPKLLNNGLQESLFLLPIIVLIILFCILKALTLADELPQNIIPYDMME